MNFELYYRAFQLYSLNAVGFFGSRFLLEKFFAFSWSLVGSGHSSAEATLYLKTPFLVGDKYA